MQEIRCEKCNKLLGKLKANVFTTVGKITVQILKNKYLITCNKCKKVKIVYLKKECT